MGADAADRTAAAASIQPHLPTGKRHESEFHVRCYLHSEVSHGSRTGKLHTVECLDIACCCAADSSFSCLQPWPDLGLLHAHIAKAAAVVERDDEAATAAEAAASILRITNGDCDVVQDMLRLRHDIEANRHRACGSD